jgi:hypothetical protein
MRDRLDAFVHPALRGLSEASSATPVEYVSSVLDMTAADVERLRKNRPKTLGIVCGRSECKKNLHCFRPPDHDRRRAPGPCGQCGVDLINWNQMWIRDLRDAPRKFEFLKAEWIRHFFFHVPISSRIDAYARNKGLDVLAKVAQEQLTQGKMIRFNEKFDWNQTKMLDGTIVHWARHAVACCCRRCMEYWHNIPSSDSLSDEDIEYFKQLVMLYIQHRMPNLQEAPSPRKPAQALIRRQRKVS